VVIDAQPKLAPIVSASEVREPRATPSAAEPAAVTVANASVSTGSAPSAAENPADPSSQRTARINRAHAELAAALDAEIRHRQAEDPSNEELPRLEQAQRLAHLAAGRLDDAVEAVESLEPSQREAFKHLMFGLGVWLSPDEARRPPLRAGKVLKSLREATSELAAASKLALPKLVFCERVEYFGSYAEFPRHEFQPKQQVILYAEVENFSAEHKSPAGFETELQGSYQIFNAQGEVVAERQLPPSKEICRNLRRDYFLAYRIYMPDSITPGRYRLELTVEDLKARSDYQGRKFGEAMIEFTIR
jgi:hypothetical protein